MIPALVGTRFVQLAQPKYPRYGAGATIGGKYYTSVIMPGGSEWLAYNLDYGTGGAYYDNDQSTYGWNGLKYGKLYTWNEAVAAANEISGWHLPTAAEWDALATAVGGSYIAAAKLKSTTGWSDGNGTDDYGFAAFPAGMRMLSTFDNLGLFTTFWTATEYSSTNAYDRSFDRGNAMHPDNSNKTNYGFSVRLIKD